VPCHDRIVAIIISLGRAQLACGQAANDSHLQARRYPKRLILLNDY
jgi:hypothetical protein